MRRRIIDFDLLEKYVEDPVAYADRKNEIQAQIQMFKQNERVVDEELTKIIQNKFLRNRVFNVLGIKGSEL